MTNVLVGDVYAKIIEDVVAASTADFEESGVGSTTLQELQEEWQAKLSQRGVAQMPWDPKPVPPVQQPQNPAAQIPAGIPNGSAPYPAYDTANGNSNGRIKTEPGTDQQYAGVPNGAYQQNGASPQGGLARAQQLVQQQYGQAASASLSAMQQQQRSGLALPGQQQKLPGPPNVNPSAPQNAQQFQAQQQAAMHRQQQQQQQQQMQQPPYQPSPQLQQQQLQPPIKIEGDGPKEQQPPLTTSLPQTDGAGDDLSQWKAMLAERRALATEEIHHADRLMHEQVMRISKDLESGLMITFQEPPKLRKSGKKATRHSTTDHRPTASASSSTGPFIPQLDGDADDDDDRADARDDDDDENAINSDLDDSDDEGQGPMGDDDDDLGDSILCTYDKVQRVKNKWKCTLKDGVMSVKGKEWVFHKGTGEFEW